MSYRDVRRETADRMGAGVVCIRCAGTTQWLTLSDHAGMCFPCYQAYRSEPPAAMPRSQSAERIRAEIAAMGKRVTP